MGQLPRIQPGALPLRVMTEGAIPISVRVGLMRSPGVKRKAARIATAQVTSHFMPFHGVGGGFAVTLSMPTYTRKHLEGCSRPANKQTAATHKNKLPKSAKQA